MSRKPYIIVLGNEKGGTGKSTVSSHIITHLLYLGYKVGSIDIDARQGTLSRFIENRHAYCEINNASLPLPVHKAIFTSKEDSRVQAENEDRCKLEETLLEFATCDFIVIDTPGNDTYLSRLAHSYADTLITPMNDSFVDLDVLVKVKDISKSDLKPSTYAEMIWERKKERLIRDKASMDWIVLRNRLSSINAKNKEEMWEILELLSKRLGYRLASGFGERVIFRELFISGLTLLDLESLGQPLQLSHIAARQELRSLMQMINLPDLASKLQMAS